MTDTSLVDSAAELDEPLLLQFTGQRDIRTLADADRLCIQAESAHLEAQRTLSQARFREEELDALVRKTEKWQQATAWCAQHGFPFGVWALLYACMLWVPVVLLLALLHAGPKTIVSVSILMLLGCWAGKWHYLAHGMAEEVPRLDARRRELVDARAIVASAYSASQEPAKRYQAAQVLCQGIRNALTSEARRKALEAEAKRKAIEQVDIHVLSGEAFEQFLVDVFRYLGYIVEHTGQSGDQGVDLIVTSPAGRTAIQAKRYETTVGNWAVQEAFTGMHYHRCQHCAVITNSTFTRSAEEAAAQVRCQLIGGVQIKDLIAGRIVLAAWKTEPSSGSSPMPQ